MKKAKAPEKKKEKLGNLLKNLIDSEDIEGAAIVRRDGILIIAEMPSSIDGRTFAAMTATMAGAAETAVTEIKDASPDTIIVEAKNTRLVSVGAGDDVLIACVARADAKLGLVLLEMKKTAKDVESVISGEDKKR